MAVTNNSEFATEFKEFDLSNRERFNDDLDIEGDGGCAYKLSGSEGNGVTNSKVDDCVDYYKNTLDVNGRKTLIAALLSSNSIIKLTFSGHGCPCE